MPASASTGAKVAMAVVALLLVGSALFLPLWRSDLTAPQYPDGLSLVVFGDRAEGDLAEIDSLNHYIGMSPLRVEDMPELALWPLGVAAAGAAVVVALFLSGVLGRLGRIYLWVFPISILAVIQFRLHQFGHDLEPGAAFRMDGFTPWVVGPTNVWNFTAWSRPGAGIFALLGAATIVTFGPKVVRKLASRGAMATLVVLALGLIPQIALGHEGHDHGTPDQGTSDHSSHGGQTTPIPEYPKPGGDVLEPFDGDVGQLVDLTAILAGVPDGGTLELEAGTYQGDITLDRSIVIDGGGSATIVGSGTGTVLTINAPGTIIRGVRVTRSGWGPSGQPAGIRITADNVTIENVVVDDVYIGIAVDGVARARIIDCHVIGRGNVSIESDSHATGGHNDGHSGGGRGDGISLWEVKGVLVRGSLIERVRDGVYVSFGSGALIDGNHVTNSRYGVHTMYANDLVLVENRFETNLSGSVLMYGGPAKVIRNSFTSNHSPSTGFGLLVKDVTDAEVVQNTMTSNRVGIHIDGPAGGGEPTRITANTVADNLFGVVVYPSAGAVFMANSFVDNVVQVAQQGRGEAQQVVWSDRGWGNFWSTYQGYDNGQGRGVVPHVEGSAVNRALVRSPLLAPFANSPALRLVGALEVRWFEQRPVAVDDLPILTPMSPAVATPVPDRRAGMALTASGGFVTFITLGALVSLSRRPRKVVPT